MCTRLFYSLILWNISPKRWQVQKITTSFTQVVTRFSTTPGVKRPNSTQRVMNTRGLLDRK